LAGILYLLMALVGTTIDHLVVPRAMSLTSEQAGCASDGFSWDKGLLGVYFLVS
jgi:hypothetical protein